MLECLEDSVPERQFGVGRLTCCYDKCLGGSSCSWHCDEGQGQQNEDWLLVWELTTWMDKKMGHSE